MAMHRRSSVLMGVVLMASVCLVPHAVTGHFFIVDGAERKPRNTWPSLPQVVGGTDAPVHRLSYHLRLNVDGELSCSAALIRADVVLTSARCIPKKGRSVRKVTVMAGSTTAADGRQYAAKRVLMHPDWDPKQDGGSAYDVALVFLEECVDMPGQADYVDIATADEFDDAQGTDWMVSGWGDTSQQLQYAVVNYQAPTVCSGLYSPGFSADTMLCAGGTAALSGSPKPLQDACAGGMGGPLVFSVNTTDASDAMTNANVNNDRLVGLVSWAQGCGASDKPATVYTHLPNLREWIVGNMGAVKGPCSPDASLYYETVDGAAGFSGRPFKSSRLKEEEGIDDCVAECQKAAQRRPGGCTAFSMTYKERKDTYIYYCHYFKGEVPGRVCQEGEKKGICDRLSWGSYRVVWG